MLVIERRPNQSVKIGDAWLIVMEVIGQRVRLGIEAPREVEIRREELLEEKPPFHGKKDAPRRPKEG